MLQTSFKTCVWKRSANHVPLNFECFLLKMKKNYIFKSFWYANVKNNILIYFKQKIL
jgi:hypothetical protein